MTETIRPGNTFRDDRGQVAQLHGIGVLRVGDRYYAWGEDKSAGGTYTAIACYSSGNLVDWRYEGDSLGREGGDLGADRVVERPKVLFNEANRQFVMLLHIDSADYGEARLGFAVSPTPVGPYEYLGARRPLGNLSRDIGVYTEDGVGYVLSEDRENGLHVYRLADDYLSVERIVSTTLKDDGAHGYESPTLVKVEGLYYLFGSDLTGWSANDNMFATATDLAGPWSAWRPFAPVGSNTFDSQVSVVVPIDSPSGIRHVYMGDRWQRDDLFHSPAVWLPLQIGDGDASLEWVDEWSPTAQ